MGKILLAWIAVLVACNDPMFCPDMVRPAPAPLIARIIPPPPAPPEPPPHEPAAADAGEDWDWIPLPADLRKNPKYLNGEVCRSLNTTCNGKQTKPCEGFGEWWTKILTRDQVLCIIAAQRIGDRDWRVNRSARAEWIRGCGAPLECR